MKDCKTCQYGAITKALEGYAKEQKLRVEQMTSRYCLLTRNHTDFTRPKTKDDKRFECAEFQEKVN